MRNQDRMLRYLAKYQGRLKTPVGSTLRDVAEEIRKGADSLDYIDAKDIAAARRKIFAAAGRAGSLY
ncbi:MAG: hypothetical protein FJZ01_00230 [Candidatus Sericytochromatia bacterium]|nr:hypothetical protein [Candidatus Tanganyikabacteria bacterium]